MVNYRTENPTTGEVEQVFDDLDKAGMDDAIGRAESAYETWRSTSPQDRAAILAKVAQLYGERAEELAAAATKEMGKPTKEALGEVQLSAMIYQWYADNGPGLLADEELPAQGAQRSVVRKEPIGVLLGVMPWNFPYYQVARFAAPNLMLGNTILLKHAEICAASALLMEQIFTEAGLPKGAYVNVFAPHDVIAQAIADPRVQGVSLTGSERAGTAVAKLAGENLKKAVLELGGSDPFIVLDAADVAGVAKAAARGRMMNSGQACNSPKRMFVADAIYDQFVDELTAQVEKLTTGDPADAATRMGPMSSVTARDTLAEQVQDAIDKGATVRTGGKVADGPGAFYPPTVLTDITPEMRAWSEELFGPVAMVYRMTDVDEAIKQANESAYGLSGSVWSDDPEKAAEVADRLDVGMAYVNEHGTTLPGLPFGGVKNSGFGRELAADGMGEFVNRKLIRVAKSK
ncbi:NAD-dependent succinate-semialdehyde dehydrogenase [Calidifontibacter sp. DB0510]|uniref:NAD-dependent succinate-semialdehyde dehydrogenase n=1 Tax=Metallococcus carri TaxID=1656884 RepID=A0A967B751_9MICO|nr:NAD-dependent succinate-semialdehyde dehydrogenase [Metallococcus carri]NHN56802.1 NAD-dependent succinate-semialdehyde dehydrogenase [Metallococcus carri]NOP37821.1 NAD-dependent succinate-semialdehyde dehydrogenase [Calidifontibacter sp. DB2511S]